MKQFNIGDIVQSISELDPPDTWGLVVHPKSIDGSDHYKEYGRRVYLKHNPAYPCVLHSDGTFATYNAELLELIEKPVNKLYDEDYTKPVNELLPCQLQKAVGV